MVEPLAGVFGAFAVVLAEPILPYALAFAAGAMVYVIMDDIIPEAHIRWESFPSLTCPSLCPSPAGPHLWIFPVFICYSFLYSHPFQPRPKIILTPSPTAFFETKRGITARWVESQTR